MKVFLSLLLLATPVIAKDYHLSSSTKQAVVGITEGWNNSHVTLGIYEKQSGKWHLVGNFWKGRIGKSGAAWGLGQSPIQGKLLKREGDKRAPVGVFEIGSAYGYAKRIVKSPRLAYHRVTTRDLWVEDANSKYYNRHLVLKKEPTTTWEKKAQMRQNDFPHSLKLYIGHNTATKKKAAIPNAGSAIFFHIWRNSGKSATSGCTTMSPQKLKFLVSQIDPKKKPVYILLPRSEYIKFRAKWKLP